MSVRVMERMRPFLATDHMSGFSRTAVLENPDIWSVAKRRAAAVLENPDIWSVATKTCCCRPGKSGHMVSG